MSAFPSATEEKKTKLALGQKHPRLARDFFIQRGHGLSLRQNIRGSIDVFLKEPTFPCWNIKNVRPFVLYCLPSLFSLTCECSENQHGFPVLNHFTRCELTEFQVRAYLREEISNLVFPLKSACPRKSVAGTGAYPDTVVILGASLLLCYFCLSCRYLQTRQRVGSPRVLRGCNFVSAISDLQDALRAAKLAGKVEWRAPYSARLQIGRTNPIDQSGREFDRALPRRLPCSLGRR